jgi:hypothetical protein
MGRIIAKIAFEYPAPGAESIADAATRRCGHRVCVRPAVTGKLQDYSAELYFEGFPEHVVKVYAFRQGAVRDHELEVERESGFPASIRCQGFDDADGIQRIYIQSHLDSENTLFEVLADAARVHEGCLEEGESNEDCELVRLDSSILTERHQNFRAAWKREMPRRLAQVLLMIIATPVWLLVILVKLPFEILQARRKNPR